MSVRHVSKYSLVRGVLPILLVCSLAMLGNPAHGQNTNSPEIVPQVLGEVSAPELRTPEQMSQAESAALAAPEQQRLVPFLPGISPSEYDAAKNAATLSAAPGDLAVKPSALAGVGPVSIILDGSGINQTAAGGAFPPQTHVAVSSTQLVEVVDSRFVVFSKNSLSSSLGSASLRAFFGNIVGTSDVIVQPRVIFDRDAQRWIIVASRLPASSADTVHRLLLGVSKTADATGSFFVFPLNFFGSSFQNGDRVDLPQLGLDQGSVLITANVGSTSVRFAIVVAINKAKLYSGISSQAAIFGVRNLVAPPIVRDHNPKSFFVGTSITGSGNTLQLFTLTNSSNPSTARLTGPVNIPVPAYSIPPNARQFGTTDRLQTFDDRFENASTQIGNDLWQVHTIASNGHPKPKFYRVNTATNKVTLSGLISASATSDDWNASIAANDLDLPVVTWSSTDSLARINAQVRAASGPVGPGTVLVTSPTFYHPTNSGVEPWGNYSAVTVDPLLSNTAWLVNEKIDSGSVWGSQIARVIFTR
jgi:hypothetical protein